MADSDDSSYERHGEDAEPSTAPGPGHPTGETLPTESAPAGAAESAKGYVGFGTDSAKKDDG